ncbi:hypothetical protein V8F20_006397 [Naviculisporaceae sp. PSN 640]
MYPLLLSSVSDILLSSVGDILQLLRVIRETFQLLEPYLQLPSQDGYGFYEFGSQARKTQQTLDLLQVMVDRLSCDDAEELEMLALDLSRNITLTRSLFEEVVLSLRRLPKRLPLDSLTRRETLHSIYFGDKPKRWTKELEARNAELQLALSFLQQTIATKDHDPVSKPRSQPRQTQHPSRPTEPSELIDNIAMTGKAKSLFMILTLLNSPPRPTDISTGRDFLREIGLENTKDQTSKYYSAKSLPLGGGDDSEPGNNSESMTLTSMMRLSKNILTHSPLALAGLGAYFMGKWRIYRPAYETMIDIAKAGNVASVFDTSPTESPWLLVAIATTTFSLTLDHYILVKQSRDRDMLVFVCVGSGAVAGLLAGLDGITVLLRVAPWCAIAAFFLCAFFLPPRNRNTNGYGTREAGGENRADSKTEAGFSAKEQGTNAGVDGNTMTMNGLGTKLDTSDVQYMV